MHLDSVNYANALLLHQEKGDAVEDEASADVLINGCLSDRGTSGSELHLEVIDILLAGCGFGGTRRSLVLFCRLTGDLLTRLLSC